MQASGLTCVVAIHRIGFQGPPDDEEGVDGYADELHGNLASLNFPGDGQSNTLTVRSEDSTISPLVGSRMAPRGSSSLVRSRLGRWSVVMETGGTTCVVTIHGIGFQTRSQDDKGIAGYADELHGNLKLTLKDALGDDPKRDSGPVYVCSEYPPTSRDIEEGLKRIGQWQPDGTVSAVPLTKGNAPISHVALVYSGDEEHVADPAAGIVLTLLGAGGATGYATPKGLLTTFDHGLLGLLHRPTAAPTVSENTAAVAAGSHSLTALVDHVGGYVARNKLRERVRMFVRDAILRIAARPDVSRIIVNSHSNGTVIAFDALPRIWPTQAKKLALFVTAGCPLRKYVFLMSWGHEIESWPVVRWLNYYDVDDLVADQLQPDMNTPLTGKPGMGGGGLFVNYTTDLSPIPVEDRQISNVNAQKHPHNYWADPEFCESLAREIGAVAGLPAYTSGGRADITSPS